MTNDRCRTKLSNQHNICMTSPILYLSFYFIVITILITGCATPVEEESTTAQIEQLTYQNAQLQDQFEESRQENEQLKQQVQVLSGLPEDVKIENLNKVKDIKIGRFTGFYDKDDDGTKEKLIVYIQPFDELSDAIKAVGTMDIQLWDLNKTNGQALLGEWKVEPEELKKSWFVTLVSINYRLTFDVAHTIEKIKDQPTVKVAFTEYTTGKIFKQQKVIKAP